MAKTIMVVDDDRGFVSLIESLLKGKGYTVLVANDGEEGIEKAKLHHPHLILMDVEMAGMQGDEAAMLVKADPATKDIPILFVTGYRTEQEIKETHEDDIIPKPVHFDQLLSKIKSLIGS